MSLANKPAGLTRAVSESVSGTVSDRVSGGVSVWAAVAVVWCLVAAQALVRWVFSPDFGPAPILGPDSISAGKLIGLRVVEVLSVSVLVGFLWRCVVRPWRTTGHLSLDGKFVLGGLVAWVADAFLNSDAYLFAWNAHSVNLGVWTAYLPFHNSASGSRYAESLLWGPPMYVYFCAGVAIVACALAGSLRRRWPLLTNVQLFVVLWAFEFLFDFGLENLIIRTTDAYAFARTYGPLTLWAGDAHQFPLYESVLVATLGCVYTWMRMAALADPGGLSPVERGYSRWPTRLQGPVRTLAVVGFCSASTILIYHLPFNWLGVIGDSTARLPSYLLGG